VSIAQHFFRFVSGTIFRGGILQRTWVIKGMSGLNTISTFEIPAGCITSASLDSLLQTLAAKHGLSDDELLVCFYKKHYKKFSALLEVTYDNKYMMRTCGSNPYFIASLVEATGEKVFAPKID